MKTTLLIPLVFLLGCATVKQDPVGEIKFWAQAAALIGTQETLREHPEYAPAFQKALVGLEMLIATGNGDPTALQQVIAQLPVDNLESREARIAVTLAKLSFARYGQNVTVDLTQRSPYVLATAEALRDGIRAALVPK